MVKFTEEDDNLIAELGVVYEVKKKPAVSAKEERIIAGFEEIQKFVDEHGRQPSFEYDKDIFERLYATRLAQIRLQPASIEILKEHDHQGLLSDQYIAHGNGEDELDDDALIGELGITDSGESDITTLRHVKPRAEIQPAKEVGQRVRCRDFDIFKPLFEKVQEDIKGGLRKVVPYRKDGSIEKGNLFILSGQKAYVASVGDPFTGVDGRNEHRLRVIFDNGVESNQLMHSLQKRLWDDETGRRITDISMGPLFDDQPQEDDVASGVIYVCRSQSDHPLIKQNRGNIHKIGVTGKDPRHRISGAENDPTFLFAKADIVASFELFNINRNKLETLLHKVFAPARLEIDIPDRFGKAYHPQEWFCVPLVTIQDAVEKVKDGSIVNYKFSLSTGELKSV
jgi:hypothetical protein